MCPHSSRDAAKLAERAGRTVLIKKFRIYSGLICLFVHPEMRKVTPILFLLIYLAAATELHQFLRLPAFFEHYAEHKRVSPTINLIDFIVLHYFKGNSNDSDYTTDRQLPFKAACLEASISLALPPDDLPETEALVFSLSVNDVRYKPIFNASAFYFSIWQPPRA
jgi:hypothetical protein